MHRPIRSSPEPILPLIIKQLMLRIGLGCILRGDILKESKWLNTSTKRAVTAVLTVALVDLQLTYILAFLGRDQIAESLSGTIADTIIGVMIGYFMKALLETFFEEREKRLKRREENDECSQFVRMAGGDFSIDEHDGGSSEDNSR